MTANPPENPLVAKPQDSTEWYTGIALAEAVTDIIAAIEAGDWIDLGFAVVGAGLDALSTVADPLGSVFSSAISALIEHFQPLTDVLDWLGGDADAVAAHAETWKNVADSLGKTADALDTDVKRDTTGWTGAAADAYRTRLTATAQLIRAQSEAARGLGSAAQTAGTLVAEVRATIRDFIADCAGRLAAWAIEALASRGFALPMIIEQASIRISRWGVRVVEMLTKLIRTLTKLLPMLDELGKVIGKITKTLDDITHGKPPEKPPNRPNDPNKPPKDPNEPRDPNDPPNDPPEDDGTGPADNPEDRQRLIDEARAQGHKISPDKVIEIGKDPNDRIVWLEEGKGGEKGAGLEHIYEEHGSQFDSAGIPRDEIPDIVSRAATEGRYTGYCQGTPPGRPIFEVDHNGKRQYIAVSIGSNGYIVGANPRSSNTPFDGAKRDPVASTNPSYRGW